MLKYKTVDDDGVEYVINIWSRPEAEENAAHLRNLYKKDFHVVGYEDDTTVIVRIVRDEGEDDEESWLTK